MEIVPAKTECAKCTEKLKEGDVCSTPDVVQVIKKELKITERSDEQIIKKARQKLGCGTESCVLKKLTDVIGLNSVREQFERRFLPIGPANNDNLLDNTNIDQTLEQWMIKFPDFYHFWFAMIDFAKYKHPIITTNYEELYKTHQCFGLIINSDVSTGNGIHWMALFCDQRKTDEWSIEFFNSSGNAPVSAIVDWMIKMKSKFELFAPLKTKIKYTTVSEIVHQQSNTECGVYSLYYIWSRLNGIDYRYFKRNRITDSQMYEFRKEIFRPGTRDNII